MKEEEQFAPGLFGSFLRGVRNRLIRSIPCSLPYPKKKERDYLCGEAETSFLITDRDNKTSTGLFNQRRGSDSPESNHLDSVVAYLVVQTYLLNSTIISGIRMQPQEKEKVPLQSQL